MCAKKRSRSSSWGVAICPIMVLAAAMLALSSATATAGFITIDQAGISAIFSQPSFGGTPIDIRFNPPRRDRRPGAAGHQQPSPIDGAG